MAVMVVTVTGLGLSCVVPDRLAMIIPPQSRRVTLTPACWPPLDRLMRAAATIYLIAPGVELPCHVDRAELARDDDGPLHVDVGHNYGGLAPGEYYVPRANIGYVRMAPRGLS